MCYASPGPKCADHVGEDKRALEKEYHASRRKLHAIMRAMDKIENEASSKEEASATQEYQDLVREKDEMDIKIDALFEDIQEAKANFDATAEGIADLEDDLRRHHENNVPEISVSWGIIKRRLAAAKETYNSQMLAYDIENGTVDCGEPSEYGDDAGIERIEKLTLKYKNKYEKATKELKKFYHHGDYVAYQNCLNHAVKTREYVQRGIVDPLIASRNTNLLAVNKYTNKLNKLDARRQKSDNAYVYFARGIADIIVSERKAGRSDENEFTPEALEKISELDNSKKENREKHVHLLKVLTKTTFKLETAKNNLELGRNACESLNMEDDLWR